MDHHSNTAEPTTDSGSALTTAPARTTTRRRLRRATGATLAGAALLAMLPGTAQAKILETGGETIDFDFSFVCDRGTAETDDDFEMLDNGTHEFTFKAKARDVSPDGEFYSEAGSVTERLSAPALGVSFTAVQHYTSKDVRVVAREGSLVTLRVAENTHLTVYAPSGDVDARTDARRELDRVFDTSLPRGEQVVSRDLVKEVGRIDAVDPCSDAIRFAAAG